MNDTRRVDRATRLPESPRRLGRALSGAALAFVCGTTALTAAGQTTTSPVSPATSPVRPASSPVSPTTAGVREDFEAFRRSTIGVIEEKAARILAAHPDDPAAGSFRERLSLIDEATETLVQRFATARDAALGAVLEEVLAAGRPGDRPRPTPQTLPAPPLVARQEVLGILTQYQATFAAGLPKPELPEEEVNVLREYYKAKATAAGKYISARGRIAAALDEKSSLRVACLCLVMPFLHIPDEEWSAAQIESFPEWMRRPAVLAELEAFALCAGRVRSAYRFAAFRQSVAVAREAPAFEDYLKGQAELCLTRREYPTAIRLLQTEFALAETARVPDAALAEKRFRLAEVFSRSGNEKLAAEEIGRVLSLSVDDDTWGRALILRLRSLYKAGQFEQALADALRHQADKRAAPYLPQVLYIGWVSARRANRLPEASRLQQDFLRRFPEHSLGADMYFASAMSSLAEGDYEEARRQLEVLEYRYPKSRVIGRARMIQQKLQSFRSETATTQGKEPQKPR